MQLRKKNAPGAQADYDSHRHDKETLETQIKNLRETLDQNYTTLNEKREAVTQHIQSSIENQSAIKALEDQITHLTQRKNDDAQTLTQVKNDLTALPNSQKDQVDINTLETSLITLESDYQVAQEAYLTLKGTVERSKQRLQTISRELEEWTTRKENATTRLEVLTKRQGTSIGSPRVSPQSA